MNSTTTASRREVAVAVAEEEREEDAVAAVSCCGRRSRRAYMMRMVSRYLLCSCLVLSSFVLVAVRADGLAAIPLPVCFIPLWLANLLILLVWTKMHRTWLWSWLSL